MQNMTYSKDGSVKTEEDDNFGSNSDSTQTMNNNKPKRHSKRFKKIACTECRQQKAKCDASDKAPESCTRCAKRGIPCRLDSDFKRTFKRAKIDELVKEYEIIKSKLQRKPGMSSKDVSPVGSYLSPINSQHTVFSASNFNIKSNMNNNTINNSNSPVPLDPKILNSSSNNSSYGNVIISPDANLKYKVGSPLQMQQHQQPTRTYSPLGMNIPSNSPLNPDSGHLLLPIPTTQSPYVPTVATPASALPVTNTPNAMNAVNNNFNFSTLITAAKSQDVNHGPSIKLTNNDSTNYSSTKVDNRAVRKPEISPAILACTPKSLGEVNLNEDQIVILYSTFLTYYHPLLPVIDMEKNIDLTYRLCPVLFWTIIFTALRGHHSLDPVINPEERRSLYFKLAPILKSVLAEISISPITRYAPSEVDEPILNASSVYSVQAFLIYTFWPPLTSSLSADSSWNTIGIAFYQAIRIGLHTPGLASDRVKVNNEDLMAEQIRTWIACNVVSETVGTVFGFPAFFQPYGSLALSLSLPNDAIPHCLKQMLEIQTFDEQVKKTLNNNTLDPLRLNQASERLPMIHLLETELNNLELTLCSPTSRYIDDFRLLALYSSRLRLFSYNFLDNDEIASFELKRGFIKTYNAALAVVQHCKQSQERDSTFIPNLPNVYILTIWQASVIIVRLVYSPYKNILDIEAGKTLYQTAINLILKASVMKHDLAYRSCGIMKSTWSLFKTLDASEPGPLKVTVRSRMSVNIFFDTLWILREKCGMISLKQGKEKNIVSGESANSDSEVDIEEDHEVEPTKNTHQQIPLSNRERESRSCSKESSANGRRKNYHPESAARRIISTIPLDPQPIALAETPQDSGSSKNTSPYAKSPYAKSPSESIKKIITPQSLVQNPSQNSPDSRGASAKPNTPVETNSKNLSSSNNMPNNHGTNNFSRQTDNSKDTEVPNDADSGAVTNADFLVDSWDIGYDLDSDMLFKNIESVMDEFGFHAAY